MVKRPSIATYGTHMTEDKTGTVEFRLSMSGTFPKILRMYTFAQTIRSMA